MSDFQTPRQINFAGCTYLMEASSGVIQSPGYGVNNYPPLVNCQWKIHTTVGVTLKFDPSFNIGGLDKLQVSRKLRNIIMGRVFCLINSRYYDDSCREDAILNNIHLLNMLCCDLLFFIILTTLFLPALLIC